MKKESITKQQLESMTTADLIVLGDKLGIEIPDNLNRTFIIGEILEATEEFNVPEKKGFSEEPDEGLLYDELY